MARNLVLASIAISMTISSATFANPTQVATHNKNILIIAIMKSASEHIVMMLRQGLNYDRVVVQSILDPNQNEVHSNLDQFFSKDWTIAKQHFSPPNVRVGARLHTFDEKRYKLYSNKLVVHFRDPREVLLSWVHHINKTKDTGGFSPIPPESYYQMPLEQQLDWAIANALPNIVTWMQGWLTYAAEQNAKADGLNILVTTYDEFKKDELKLLHKIVTFYDIPANDFEYKPVQQTEAINFRKGDSNEWREVFTKEQKIVIAGIVPDRLLDQLNWEK